MEDTTEGYFVQRTRHRQNQVESWYEMSTAAPGDNRGMTSAENTSGLASANNVGLAPGAE